MLEIRRASAADADAIALLVGAVFRAAFAPVVGEHVITGRNADERAARWRAAVARSGAEVLLGEHGGKLRAVALLAPARDEDLDDPTVARIEAFHVHPDHWREGIGRRRMEEVVERLRTRGFREAVLWSLEANERANGFYAALGWERDGARGEWEGAPTVRYRRPL